MFNRSATEAAPNNDMRATANSVAFMRETCLT